MTPSNTEIYSDFTLSITTTGGTEDYIVSLDPSKKNYISKVLGTKPSQLKNAPALYVDELYQNTLTKLVSDNISSNLTTVKLGTLTTVSTDMSNYASQYQSAQTPWILSEVKEGIAKKLFKLITISDGNSSNSEVKFTIENINIDSRTFNITVRSFNDTDSAPVVLERFSRLSLDELSTDFIGKKIGTSDGKYEVRSKYFVIEMNEDEDVSNEIPCGFMGYPFFKTGGTPLNVAYKTTYELTDNKRKNYLGLNSSLVDSDLFNFKGVEGNGLILSETNGFHLETEGASVKINGVTKKLTSPTGVSIDFESETALIGTALEKVSSRRFVVMPYGGFDGWDIYRSYRTNETIHNVNKYLTPTDYDSAKLVKDGFSKYTTSNGLRATNSDYYAFLEGVLTISNPKETDINVVATPGIDYDRNGGLVSEIIDIVELDRADSVYIINAPNAVDASNAVYALEDSGIDSNYSATYYPWKMYSDPENSVYVNMSVTADVLRNIAIVDKKSQPWYAVAGLNRGDVKCVKALTKMKTDDTETLYEGRINPVETIINQGVKIWGNKTLQVNESALSQLNVRRLLLQARKLIAAAALKLVFDPNDSTVRSEFLKQVNPILESMRKDRGLQDFRVEIDESVESIERKELNARILIKPTLALEYITIEFGITPQGVSFDDV